MPGQLSFGERTHLVVSQELTEFDEFHLKGLELHTNAKQKFEDKVAEEE